MLKPTLKPFDDYQNINIGWIDRIPSNWLLVPGMACFEQVKNKNIGLIEQTILSLSYGKVIIKPASKLGGLLPTSFETYHICKIGDIVVRSIDLQNDTKSLRIGLVKHKGIITSAYLKLRPFKCISSEYLYYLLHNYDLQKVFYSLGSGVRQNLDWSDFKRLSIPLPPLETQNKIVKYLNHKTQQAECFIEKQTHLIELLEEQKKAITNKAVTQGIDSDVAMKDSGNSLFTEMPEHWNILKLSHVTKILRGRFSHRPRNDPSLYDGSFPFIQTGDVARANKYVEQYSQTLNKFGYRVSKEFPEGTLVMTIAANIGDIAILNFKACFPDSIVGFFPYKNIDLDYLYYSLKSLKDEFIKQSPVSTQANLRVEIIGAMKIAVPPIEEQKEIYSFIEAHNRKTDLLIKQAKSEIKLTKEYLNSLTYQVVTGQVEVKE